MSENLVENCDRLRNYNLCSTSKENNGNMNGLMKFLAITNDFYTQSAILAHGNYVKLTSQYGT